ncbi:hypothetical protein P5673_027086 [Acropora cervicornis]|uniref:Uncharacterized protein n=1 Tax=Acropora cervicornis TaxID=6130 RepID=A0AAD9PZN6_ACRCE|nr:hypothetical protein P5673_027086 [Acropora cervicornis]
MAFVEDILLKANSLSHHGDLITENEELSPALENFVVLKWLKLIHPDLSRLVKQRYGTGLRSRTLASIKAEVSQALNSLLDEIRASDDAKVMRTATVGFQGEDRKYIAKARQIANILDDHLEESEKSAPFPSDCEFNNEISSVECVPEPAVLRVQTRQSP